MNVRRVRRVMAALAVAVLAACGGDDPSAIDEAPPDAVVDVETNPGTSEGFEGARDDVTDVVCEPEDGRWIASGTVTNSSSAPASYRIYVSFLDADRFTVGLLQIDVEATDPGTSVEWAGGIDVDGSELDCILRVERTPEG